MRSNIIRLGIVDDHMLIRKAFRNWLSQYSDFEITIDAENGLILLDRLEANIHIDVLLLDLSMPKLNGIETLRILRLKYPHIKVLIVSMYFEPEIISELLDLGIYGYLSKNSDPAEFIEAIRASSTNTIYQNQVLTKTLYWRTTHALRNYLNRNTSAITENQKKILQLLWKEKNTQEIADEIFLSVSAVDKIKQQLKEKTGAKTTVGLLKYAIEKKIITPSLQPAGINYE